MNFFLGIYLVLLGSGFTWFGSFGVKKLKQAGSTQVAAGYIVIFMGVMTICAGIFTAVSGLV